MRIAEVVPSLESRHGGPSRSVLGLSRALADLGHSVDLLTAGQQAAEQSQGTLRTVTSVRGFPEAVGRSRGLKLALESGCYDCVHHHGLWLRSLHYAQQAAVRLQVPLILSPRGMATPWAWHHRRWKKALASRVIHPGAFDTVAGWHATSEAEADDLRALGFQQPICVAGNGVTEPSASTIAEAKAYWSTRCPDLHNKRVALFYSRFHHKKRVLELIDLWVRSAPPSWVLLMVGIPQEYTVKALESYVLNAGGAGRVFIFDGTEAPMPYAVASLFLLPSHSENFGQVMAEALVHGLPIIVTDSTPWQAVNAAGIGACVPWPVFAAAMQEALATDESALREKGTRARAWVAQEISWRRTAEALADFYLTLNTR